MKIVVVGTGYVGLVAGAGFAEFGFRVVGVDVDTRKIQSLREGKVPIYEPELDRYVERGVREGRLSFTTDLREAVEEAEVVFLSVGTPPATDGAANLDALFAAGDSVADALAARKKGDFCVVAVKSTVPVGTCRTLRERMAARLPLERFAVASNPEFLREGAAMNDFLRPDRIVVGSEDARATDIMKRLYQPLYLLETPLVVTTFETAELIKYATNGFLATKVSFINEVANFCDAVGADVHVVAKALGLDGRIGRKFLHPGPGFGGSCFPKDTRALTGMGRAANSPFRIVEAVLETNAKQAERMVEKIETLVGGSLQGKRVAVLGLAFKPNTDDIRESPALKIVPALIERGAEVRAHDPVAMNNAKRELPASVSYAQDAYEAATGCHAVVLLTEWNQFRTLDLARLRSLMAEGNFADLRNVYEPKDLKAAGFRYTSVGRSCVAS